MPTVCTHVADPPILTALLCFDTHTDKLSGSFGSTFWRNEATNHAESCSDEGAWSVTANTSTVDTRERIRDDKDSRKHDQVKKVKPAA